MNIKKILALSALSLAAGAVLADESALTRAQVGDGVIEARASGMLVPAGERSLPSYATATTSTVTREQVKAEASKVYAAKQRAIAEYESAANSVTALDYARQVSAPSGITSAERKETTLAARAHGELMGAGERAYAAAGPESDTADSSAKTQGLFAFVHRH
jgi:Domain of unknown function (DUF4148)